MEPLRVLYCDNHLLAVWKEPGLVVQGTRDDDESLLVLAKAWVAERFHKPGKVFLGVVHRLDRPVAGVVLFGRTSKAASRLSDEIRGRRVVKEYRAVVAGEPPASAGRLTGRLRREGTLTVVARDDEAGQDADLDYEVLDRRPGRALLRILLGTGRRHQIRAQLAAAGLPIVGDERYGGPGRLSVPGIALMACRLEVLHPTLREPVVIEAEAPSWWPWPPDGGAP